MTKPVYRRVVAKVSGEALMGPDRFGIHQPTLERIAADLLASRELGVEIAVVVGGGNIFRGVNVSEKGIPRVTGDLMGMRATVMNALALESAMEKAGLTARTMSALGMPQIYESYARRRALRHIEQGRVLLLEGGTGNPFFTTDTTAVLRAAELGAEAVLKATDVDGVYSADPKQDRAAKRYDRLTHQEALERNLKVMDSTAFALARANRMPIIVFSIREKGAIAAVLRGEGRSTVVGSWRGLATTSRENQDMDRPICSRERHGKPDARHQRDQAPHAGRNPVAETGIGWTAHGTRLGEPARTGTRRGLRHPHAAEPSRDHQCAETPTHLGAGVGQIDGARRRKGNRR